MVRPTKVRASFLEQSSSSLSCLSPLVEEMWREASFTRYSTSLPWKGPQDSRNGSWLDENCQPPLPPPGWRETSSRDQHPQVSRARAQPYLRLRLLVGCGPSVADLAPIPRVLVGSPFFQFSFRPPLSHEEIVHYPKHQSLWGGKVQLFWDKPLVKTKQSSPNPYPILDYNILN